MTEQELIDRIPTHIRMQIEKELQGALYDELVKYRDAVYECHVHYQDELRDAAIWWAETEEEK